MYRCTACLPYWVANIGCCGFCHSNSLCLYLDDREHPAPVLGDNHLVGQVLELIPQVGVLQLHSGSRSRTPTLLNREERLFSQCRIVVFWIVSHSALRKCGVPHVRVFQLHSGSRSRTPALLNREEKLFSRCRIVISLLECFSLSIAQVWRARKVRVLQLISRSRVRMLCLYYLLNRGDFIFT